MKIRPGAINIYLCVFLVSLLCGCETTKESKTKDKKGKEASTMRLHLEMNPDGSDRAAGVPVFRERPVLVTVDRTPFITEADIDQAEVVSVEGGGYAIKLLLNRHGALVMDTVTTANKGRRIVPQSTWTEMRWLGAPIIKNRIATGVFVFTPDATKEESERIVLGLNNLINKARKKARF